MLWEVLITRVFSVVLFADLAHLALAVAMLGVTLGGVAVAVLPPPKDDDALARRVGRLLLAQAVASLLVTVAALWLPLTDEASPLVSWYERDRVRFSLLRLPAFLALVAVLPAPAVASGAAMASIFLRPARVARAYAADLGAAALAALLFVPLSRWIAPPDLSLLAVAVCAAAAAVLLPRRGVPLVLCGGALVGLAVATRAPLLPLRHAAGWAEAHVVRSAWTPTARLAIFSGPGGRGIDGDYLLLDNGSASLIVTEEAQVAELEGFVSRGLVYALHPTPGRVAILAAGAGPEAAVALRAGQEDILLVDLDAEMFEMARAHAPAPNPLRHPGVSTVAMDARAALRQAPEAFDIIQLVHPNLTTATGMLNSAWSPRLLYTREAIGVYLDRLSEDGTLSITAPELHELALSVHAALLERGVDAPAAHVYTAITPRHDQVLLVKPRPFTRDEAEAAAGWLSRHGVKPTVLPDRPAQAFTDDRPYTDSPAMLLGAPGPMGAVYRTMLWSLGVLMLVLGAVAALALRAWPSGLRLDRAAWRPLGLAGCLGYGYLAVEVVLIHRLVPLVGHPVYALTTVLVAMLAGSAAGSALAEGARPARLPAVLVSVAVLGGLTAAVLPPLGDALLWGSVTVRAVLVGAALLPLAVVAGMAMPLALRAVGQKRPSLAALMWAVNGWASVLAATGAVLVARFAGYRAAMLVALGAYLLAAILVGVTRRHDPDAAPERLLV